MYKIVDTHNKATMATGFASREAAKPARNKLNSDAGVVIEKDVKPRFVISRDTMHPRGETDGIDHSDKPNRWL